MKPISCASVGKYGNATLPQKPLKPSSTDNVSSQTKSVQFWTVSPNPICCTCEGDGLMMEKGSSHFLPCVDCGRDTCLGCLYCSDMLERGGDIWCAKHGMNKSPFQVCASHKRR
jgi:hypothetical protein